MKWPARSTEIPEDLRDVRAAIQLAEQGCARNTPAEQLRESFRPYSTQSESVGSARIRFRARLVRNEIKPEAGLWLNPKDQRI